MPELCGSLKNGINFVMSRLNQTKHMKIVTFLLFATLFTGCMSSVNLQLMRPADVSVPQRIQTVAIANRTASSKQVLNIIEGILTGEGIGQDKEGAQQVLVGAQNKMQESTRYNVIRTNVELTGGAVGNLAPPLSWEEVEKICNDHQAQALLVLEEYDTDWIITNGSKPVKKKDSEGREYTITEFWAEGVATARIGFRLYDPAEKTIYDQHRFSHNTRWTATGSSVADALAHLINKRAATNRVSYITGEVYATRITPSWYNARREVYKKSKGNDLMKSAIRRSNVADWEGAAEYWQKAVSTADRKTRGRAAFNLAVANEVLGNLEEAKSWADKAYTDYGNKKARDYSNLLRNRMWEVQKVKEQMGDN